MSRRDLRSHNDRRTGTPDHPSPARRLHQRAGRPPAPATRGGLLEALENRVLMAGDHPSFGDFPLADNIVLDAAGEGQISGLIEAPGQDDMLKFTAPTNDFVTVLADTVNFLGGSSLNSKIEVYTADGMGSPLLLTSASGNGVLAGGTPTDAWAGFIATAGTTYYIRVLSDVALAFGSAGGYNLRVDSKSTPLTLDAGGASTVTGSIGRLQQDQIYRVTAPVANLLTALADTPTGLLDSRIEFFDSTGAPLGAASSYPTVPTGTSTDGYVGFETTASATYYIRVRSDSFNDTSGTGSFTLRVNIDTADPDTPSITPVTITSGAGTSSASIDTASEQDVFKFTTTGADFTTILADSINAGTSLLDSRLEVFDAATGQLLRQASDSGMLTSGLVYDPWSGFLSTAGRTYLVRVRSDSTIGAGLQATGAFDLRITTTSNTLTLNATGEARTPSGPAGSRFSISRLEQDFIFRLTEPVSTNFAGLAFVNAQAIGASRVDTRVDIFDKNGNLVASDSESGYLNDAFSTWNYSASAEPYYIRVRSDDFKRTSTAGTGPFAISVDVAPTAIAIDPVSRTAVQSGSFIPAVTAPPPNQAFLGFYAQSYQFVAQGSGATIISALAAPPPNFDMAISLYNKNGELIAFNDDYVGTNSQITALLTGGDTYYLVVDTLRDIAGAAFSLSIESHATLDPTLPIDDHASALDYANATPIAWNPPRQATVTSAPNAYNPLTGRWTFAASVDHPRVVIGTGTGRIEGTGDTDLFVFVPQINMNGGYAGKDGSAILPTPPPPPNDWAPRPGTLGTYRPSTRVEVQIQPMDNPPGASLGTAFLNTRVRIFDSRGIQVYPTDESTNDFIFNPSVPQEPAGMVDPARYPQTLDIDPMLNGVEYNGEVFGVPMWAGEPYYIEVSGAVTGRYNLEVITDAMPLKTSIVGAGAGAAYFDGQSATNRVSRIKELPDFTGGVASGFSNAHRISLNSNGDGDHSTGIDPFFNTGGAFERVFETNGASADALPDLVAATARGVFVFQQYTLPGIEAGDDTDLYTFTAPKSGTAEIRINTTDLTNDMQEIIGNGEAPGTPPPPPTITTRTATHNFDSLLDSKVYVYDNDFNLVATNDNNAAISGESQSITIGTFAARTFHKRDPRVVVPIQSGDKYYIRVESSQRDAYIANQADHITPVNWRNLIGSYELLVHTVPTLTSDDHSNNLATSTVIPIDEVPGSPTNGTGTVTGTIETAADADLFSFISPARGPVDIHLERRGTSTLIGEITVFDAAGGLISRKTALSNGIADLTITALPGERFFVQVASSAATTGAYTVDLSGLGFDDDHADFGQFSVATPLAPLDFIGVSSAAGSVEVPGDTDVFSFTGTGYRTVTLTIDSTSTTFDPIVEVYEIQIDPTLTPTATTPKIANPILHRITFNNDGPGIAPDSRTTFSVTPGRQSALTGLVYNQYYIVVRGATTDADYGDYTVTAEFTPTDDHPDAGQFDIADTIPMDTATGLGAATGVIETDFDALATNNDTDLFVFTAPASGDASVIVSRPIGGTLVPKVTVFEAGSPPTQIATGTGSSVGGFFLPAQALFTVRRGVSYYVLVEGTAGTIGAYNVNVTAPAIDDYPNATEWDLAAPVTLGSDGDGHVGTTTPGDASNPTINPTGDTDLFTFTTVAAATAGSLSLTVTPYNTPVGVIAPTITVYDSTFTQVVTLAATTAEQIISVTIPGAAPGTRFYVLIGAVPGVPGATVTGEYLFNITGPASSGGGGGGGGGDPGAIDFSQAVLVDLDQRTGDGKVSDAIDIAGDRDVFKFTARAAGKIYIQVLTPSGSVNDAGITILDAADESAVVASDTAGIPGATADVEFANTTAPKEYWIIVSGLAGTTGAYTICIDATPVTNYLYYPEGYASSTIREFVSIANPNDRPVNYSVYLRYETGDLETLVSSGSIEGGARGGVTVSNGIEGAAAGVRTGVPYALVIESDGPLSATFAHYDFDASLGDAFSGKSATDWAFPRIERLPGSVLDFMLFYNPNTFDVDVTYTVYPQGGGAPIVLSQTVGALRRSGVNVNDTAEIPVGISAVVVTSKASSAADQSRFIGIVASVSHYDTTLGSSGWGYLGDPDGGATRGAIPSITRSDQVSSEIALFNPGAAPATVNLTGVYTRAALPDLNRSVDIPPRSTVILSGIDLGLVANQPAGIRFNSNVPIVSAVTETQLGDANGTLIPSSAGTSYFFGDAFINPALAGQLYFETLNIFNPASVTANVTIRLLFTDSNFIDVTRTVGPRGFSEVRLHELPELIDPGALAFFSISVSAATPIVTTLTHYDLFLGGGWTTNGAPLGLTNLLSTIS
ncbi:MAG: hypothetical protein IT436_17995 [Phycisphaerales bacterium]|nr:hypothetical protein [Phycisphaerales bacterium]